MSSPTLCSVWEKWEAILLSPGKIKIQWYSDNNYFSELNRIDGQLVEFERKIFLGFTTVGILNQIQQMMGELLCEPQNFTGRIIFMSMLQKEMMKYVTLLKSKLGLCSIVNGIDKFVREAMPIREEEKASGKPAAKARPILKPSSTSGWVFIPTGQRQWIDTETQESNDPH